MGRITNEAITGQAISLHLLAAADEVPNNTDYDGNGTNNLVSPLVELGDLEDSWNTTTYNDYKSYREQILQTFRGVQELEITLPWRISETAQAAIIGAFTARTELIFAFVIGNGQPTPDEDQITFTALVISRNDMLSAKEDRMTFKFTVNIQGEVAYSAKVT